MIRSAAVSRLRINFWRGIVRLSVHLSGTLNMMAKQIRARLASLAWGRLMAGLLDVRQLISREIEIMMDVWKMGWFRILRNSCGVTALAMMMIVRSGGRKARSVGDAKPTKI